MQREVNRNTLQEKNRQYLDALRAGRPALNVMGEILYATFDSSADAILVFDQDKRIVLANAAAARLSGWDLEDVSRETLHERFSFFSNEFSELPLPIEEEPLEVAMRERKSCLKEAFVRGASVRAGGVWMRAHAAPVLDDDKNVVGVVTVFQDITEQVRAKFQRDCLTALIAHDLKNHLAAEHIMLSLLKGLLPRTVDEKFVSLVQTMTATNEQYLMMTESLLELSRAGFFSDSSFFKSVCLVTVLENAVNANIAAARQRQVTVELDLAPSLPETYGLPATVDQVFTNLVLNAIQASPNGGTVIIKAFATSSDNPQVLITDNGPGMTDEQVASLFDPSRVAGHHKTTSNSTGFGVFLAAMLVQSQNGAIFCRSAVGKGTTIGVEFQRAPVNS